MNKQIQRRRDELSLGRTALNEMQARVGNRTLAKEIMLAQKRIRRNQEAIDNNRERERISKAIDAAYKPLKVTW
jgi:hypothetical protein